MEALKLYETKHPLKDSMERYESLIGLDSQKGKLLQNLKLFFDQNDLEQWQKRHHPNGLKILKNAGRATPLILLSGDVGCGKTELASSIATPLSKALDDSSIWVFETPSDTRGSGLVGELSARITEAFRIATSKLGGQRMGILIIDEADDLATERDQQQAHHEDRAGVNALIKEIDRIQRDKTRLVVVLITNRTGVLDPAIRRRAMIDIQFDRPDERTIYQILEYLTRDLEVTSEQTHNLAALCKACHPSFSYSDFFTRIARQAVLLAQQRNQPYSVEILTETIQSTKPSPKIEQS